MKVYFDLDSVLADFNRGVVELCGLPTFNQEEATKQSDDAMWAAIRDTAHFYDRLELMPGAREMFDLAYNALGADCQILSAIPKTKRGILTAGEDKVNWVHRMLHPDIKVNIVYKEEKKKFCTGADCVLVDDLEANIEAWRSCGGTGILHIDAKSSMEQLRKYVLRQE